MPKKLPPNREWFKDRNDRIRAQRRQRYSLPDIAKYWGLTVQRVSVICKGVKPKKLVDK